MRKCWHLFVLFYIIFWKCLFFARKDASFIPPTYTPNFLPRKVPNFFFWQKKLCRKNSAILDLKTSPLAPSLLSCQASQVPRQPKPFKQTVNLNLSRPLSDNAVTNQAKQSPKTYLSPRHKLLPTARTQRRRACPTLHRPEQHPTRTDQLGKTAHTVHEACAVGIQQVYHQAEIGSD